MPNQTIVIVGASRGIGKELVEKFANDSSNTVFALSRNLQKMKELFGNFPNVQTVEFDLAMNVEEQGKAIFENINQIDGSVLEIKHFLTL